MREFVLHDVMLLCNATERDTQKDSERAFFRLLVRESRRGGSSRNEQSIYDLVASVPGLVCLTEGNPHRIVFRIHADWNRYSSQGRAVTKQAEQCITRYSLAEDWNNRLDCSRFNTLWSYIYVLRRVYFIVSFLKVFHRIRDSRSELF